MPAAQPFGVTDLLLGFGSLLLVSTGASVTTVTVADVGCFHGVSGLCFHPSVVKTSRFYFPPLARQELRVATLPAKSSWIASHRG